MKNVLIQVDERLVGIWYLRTTPEQDWMGGLSRGKGRALELSYRFRTYQDNGDPFSGGDPKDCFRTRIEKSESGAIESVRAIVRHLKEMAGSEHPIYEVLVENGDIKEFVQRLRAQPWMHARQIQ